MSETIITDPLFYAMAIPAILLTGISKGGFGGGVVTMSVPLISLAAPVSVAVAVMLPILMIMDVINIWIYRGQWDRRHLGLLVIGAACGTFIGWELFQTLSAAGTKLLIGLVALIFTVNHAFNLLRRATATQPGAAKGVFWGTVSGVTSFIAHAGGPPANFYMLPLRLEKATFIGTMAYFFWIVNMMKVYPYYQLDQLTLGNFATSLVLLPLTPVGMWIGVKMQGRISDEWFYRLCYGLLFATGVKLTYDGIVGL